jgi:hypothetical protein
MMHPVAAMPETLVNPCDLVFSPRAGVTFCTPGTAPSNHVVLAKGIRRTNDLKWWLSTREAQAALSSIASAFYGGPAAAEDLAALLRLFGGALHPWCIPTPPGEHVETWTSLGAFGTPPVEFEVESVNYATGSGGPSLPDLRALIGGDVTVTTAAVTDSLLAYCDEEADAEWKRGPRDPVNRGLLTTTGAILRGNVFVDGVLPASVRGFRARAAARISPTPGALYPGRSARTSAPAREVAVEWKRTEGGPTRRVVCADVDAARELREALRDAGYPEAFVLM